jgi:hypothetical protein
MEISITRFYDKKKNKTGLYIDRSDWISYIRRSPFLSVDITELRGHHPVTHEEILIPPRTDVGYFKQRSKLVAIQYDDGGLRTECDWDDTAKLVLRQIANEFGAVLLDENKEIIPI